MTRLVLLPALALGVACSARAEASRWEPTRTWLFQVGVLEFQDAEGYPPFPKEGRLDDRLRKLLLRRGVPRDQVVVLQDQAATRAGIRRALDTLLARTAPGDTLILQYFGHGARGDEGRGYFIAHDTRSAKLAATGWPMASVVEQVRAGFQGSRVLLTADSCFSGTLARVVDALPDGEGPAMAALTSSLASEISTVRWTFTECLLDGFGGRPGADLDGDGVVRLGELATHTRREMAFAEHQFSAAAYAGGADPDLVLAPARPRKHVDVGKRVQIQDEGTWYRARVVKVRRDGAWKVHYLGWDREYDEWLAPDSPRVREPVVVTYPVGARVEVRWEGEWFPAEVLRQELGLHFIHYTGDGDEWDEWVGPERIRTPAE